MKLIFLVLSAALAGYSLYNKKQRTIHTEKPPGYTIDTLASGLTVPGEIVFLPDKTIVFTERNGKVRIFRNNQLISKPASVVNDVDSTKKMGLLGMCIHPQFSKNKSIYLSFNYRKENLALLKIVRYQFMNDALVNPTTILENINASPNHTGCRLRFGPDEKLYITTGDADRPILAQDLKSLNGKILRVNDDGSIPSDNPFVNNGTARKEIWTYGHRNTQGIDFRPGTGQLFTSEHGPTGGDEINIIVKGHNYGWPVVHHKDKKDGMNSPLIEYTPSIGPSQVTFYTGNAFPFLKGKLLVACLRGEKIIQLQVERNRVISEENLMISAYGRIRALAVGPDGYIYFSTSQNDPPEGKPRADHDMLLRLRPSATKIIKAQKAKASMETDVKAIGAKNPIAVTYMQLCASCHGTDLEGTERAKSMLDNKWEYGFKKNDISRSIREGIIEKGMPAWEGTLTKKEIEKLLIL